MSTEFKKPDGYKNIHSSETRPPRTAPPVENSIRQPVEGRIRRKGEKSFLELELEAMNWDSVKNDTRKEIDKIKDDDYFHGRQLQKKIPTTDVLL